MAKYALNKCIEDGSGIKYTDKLAKCLREFGSCKDQTQKFNVTPDKPPFASLYVSTNPGNKGKGVVFCRQVLFAEKIKKEVIK